MYEMSDCVSVVEKRRNEYGMTVRALSQKSGVQEDALYNILGKKRKMTASELLSDDPNQPPWEPKMAVKCSNPKCGAEILLYPISDPTGN